MSAVDSGGSGLCFPLVVSPPHVMAGKGGTDSMPVRETVHVQYALFGLAATTFHPSSVVRPPADVSSSELANSSVKRLVVGAVSARSNADVPDAEDDAVEAVGCVSVSFGAAGVERCGEGFGVDESTTRMTRACFAGRSSGASMLLSVSAHATLHRLTRRPWSSSPWAQSSLRASWAWPCRAEPRPFAIAPPLCSLRPRPQMHEA